MMAGGRSCCFACNAAYVASVELAPGKARSAALFKKPSQALEEAINHGRFAAVTARDFIEMRGGLPIVVDGQVIGGIGFFGHRTWSQRGHEAGAQGISVPVALRVLAMDEETLRDDQMKLVFRPCHRNIEELRSSSIWQKCQC
jgi:hypothetical protein